MNCFLTKKLSFFYLIYAIVLASSSGFAGSARQTSELDSKTQAENKQALQDTQGLLTNKSARQESISKDAKAKAADATVNNLTGGDAATNEDIYALSAEVLGSLGAEAGNDPAKMNELILAAQKDPKAFLERLNGAQRAKVKAIADKIESKAPAGSNRANP